METIPFKKPRAADIASSIFTYYEGRFPDALPDSLLDALEELQKTRNLLQTVLNNPDSPRDVLKQALFAWLSWTDLLASCVPFAPPQYSQKQSRPSRGAILLFQWSKAFSTTLSSTGPFYYSLKQETLALYFCIGAWYASEGFAVQRTESAGQKTARSHFTNSAAFFDRATGRIKDSGTSWESLYSETHPSKVLCPEERPVVDFDEEDRILAAVFCAAMRAQAQLCVYEKGVSEKGSRSLLSKLAAQVAQFYQDAVTAATPLGTSLPKALLTWLEVQRVAFLAAAHFQKAKHDAIAVEKVSEGYGPLITRLRLTRELCLKAKELMAQETHVIVDIKDLLDSCTVWLEELEKDNATVYLEAIPDSVEALEKLSAVPNVESAIIEQQCCASAQSDPRVMALAPSAAAKEVFASLVPVPVKEALDEFETRVQSQLKAFSETAHRVSEKLGNLSRVWSLPYVAQLIVDPSGCPENVPDALWEKIDDFQKRGGDARLRTGVAAVAAEAKTCQKLLERLEATNATYLAEIPTTKNQGSSGILLECAEILQRYRLKLKSAEAANIVVESSYKTAAHQLPFLEKTRLDLAKALPIGKKDSDFIINEHPTPQSDAELANPHLVSCSMTVAKRQVREAFERATAHLKNLEQLIEDMDPEYKELRADLQKHLTQSFYLEEQEFSLFKIAALGRQSALANTRLASIQAASVNCERSYSDLEQACLKHQVFLKAVIDEDPRVRRLQALDTSITAFLEAFRDNAMGLAFYETLQQHLNTLEEQMLKYHKTSHLYAQAAPSSLSYGGR